MAEYINYTIAVILASILLLFAPVVISELTSDMTMKRGVMDEMRNFIDVVADSGTMSETQLRDFQIAVASYGTLLDIDIYREAKVLNPNASGGVTVSHVRQPAANTWYQGDHITVVVSAVHYSGAQRILYSIIGLNSEQFSKSMSAMIRR